MKIIFISKKFLIKYKKYAFQYLLLILISWLVSMVIPYFTGKYIDLLVNIKNKSDIYFYTKVILILGIISCFSSYFKNIVYQKLESNAVNSMNLYLIEHIKRLPLSFFRNTNSVYIIERIRTDTKELINFNINQIIILIINIFTCIISFRIMFSLNLKIGAVFLAVMPIYIGIYSIFKNKLYSARKNYIETYNSFISSMNQQIDNVLYIKLNSLYNFMHKKIKTRFEEFFTYIMKLTKIDSLYGNINNSVDSVANVILFLYGGLEIYKGNLTVGEFTIINLYFNMAFESIQYFVTFGGVYQRTLVSYNRINEILQTPKENNGFKVLKNASTIKLENVNFSYTESQHILTNFNYSFKRGTIYCVKGFNGSGKSTLIKVLLGIEQKYTGKIFIEDVQLEDLNMYELRRNLIGITEQEPILLNDTLKNNLILNNSKAIDNEKIIDYCKKLCLTTLIESLPNGLDTIIDENNFNISGGEKQKISIIKALLKNPDIIILDEPSSALDENSIDN